MFTSQRHPSTSQHSHIHTYVHIVSLHVHYYTSMQGLCLLGLVHPMLESMQQAGITYEMPAPYKLACTHRRETHWHCQAGVNSLSLARQSKKARQRQASLLVITVCAF